MPFVKTGRYSREWVPESGSSRIDLSNRAYAPTTGAQAVGKMPEFDQSRITALMQEQLAPAIGSLRRQVREVGARRYGSPVEEREALRGAIRGYGESLAPLQAQSARTAMSLYMPEYQAQIAAYRQALDEQRREEARQERRGSFAGGGGGGETYRQAAARLEAWDPYARSSMATTTAPSSSHYGLWAGEPIGWSGRTQNYSSDILAGTGL